MVCLFGVFFKILQNFHSQTVNMTKQMSGVICGSLFKSEVNWA